MNAKINYCNFCFTIATNSEEYLSSNARTFGSPVRAVVDLFVSVFSLVATRRLSAGSDGILSIVVELLELVMVVVVLVSVATVIRSCGSSFFEASGSGGLS